MADPLNPSALEPLFAPWEEPNSHRVRADKEGHDKPGSYTACVSGSRPHLLSLAIDPVASGNPASGGLNGLSGRQSKSTAQKSMKSKPLLMARSFEHF
jgi:hypothetical protein